jgi:hypothetical protein
MVDSDVYLARLSAHEFRESARRAFPVRRVVFHARTCVFSVFTFYNPSTYSHVASFSPKKFQGSAHSRRRRRALRVLSRRVFRDTSPVFLPYAPDPISRLLRLPATEDAHTSLCLPQSRAWHAFEQ